MSDYWDEDEYPDDRLLTALRDIGPRHRKAPVIQAELMRRAQHRAATLTAEASRELGDEIAKAAARISRAGEAQEKYARNLAWATWALVLATLALVVVQIWG